MAKLQKNGKKTNPRVAKPSKISQQVSKDDRSHNILIISVIVIALAVMILLFWNNIFDGKQEPTNVTMIEYNGYTFYQRPPLNLWMVTLPTLQGNVTTEFYYQPLELEMLEFNSNITRDVASLMLMKGRIFIGYDAALVNEGIAAVAGSEIAKVTGKLLRVETKSGFTSDVGAQVPIVNCSLATYNTMVIEMRIGTENKIEYNDRCVVIYSVTRHDLIKNADYFSYKLLGVIPTFRNTTNINITYDNISGSVNN